jgi:hypothetical protein
VDNGEEGDNDIDEVDMFVVSYAFNLPIICLKCMYLRNRRGLRVIKSWQVFRCVRPLYSTLQIVEKLSDTVTFVTSFGRWSY